MKKGVILCEGSDEKHFIYHLLNKIYGIDSRDYFNFPDLHGYEQVLEVLPTQIKDSERKPIGLILDANTSLSERWEAIKNILTKANYTNIPTQPAFAGTYVIDNSPQLPKVGIWIMPDNTSEGMLENFIRHLIPENDDLINMSDQTIQQLIDTEINRFKIVHKSKAEIHTWLAWQEEPGTPMGQAITKQYLETENELARKFIGWLDNVFCLSDE